ncbi:hypothetical protein B0H10DRAFT_1953125 [Mycena sp. CBHHK59/15]|nr:hypothetical protein B0H10DRAFT_1953125 [Mycena sp. CBHHK59/15]
MPAQALLLCRGQGVVAHRRGAPRRRQAVVAWVLHNGKHAPPVGDPVYVHCPASASELLCRAPLCSHRGVYADRAGAALPAVGRGVCTTTAACDTAAPAGLLLWGGLKWRVTALLRLHVLAHELGLRDRVVLSAREDLEGGLQEHAQTLGGIRVAVFGGLGSRDVRCGRKEMENRDLLIPQVHLMQLLPSANPPPRSSAPGT